MSFFGSLICSQPYILYRRKSLESKEILRWCSGFLKTVKKGYPKARIRHLVER